MREKLIELLNFEPCPIACIGSECPYFDSERCYNEKLADYLIANGVTVQRCGRWEKYGYKWRCNNCLAKINIDGTPEENGLYFCPNCGAKMRGDRDA